MGALPQCSAKCMGVMPTVGPFWQWQNMPKILFLWTQPHFPHTICRVAAKHALISLKHNSTSKPLNVTPSIHFKRSVLPSQRTTNHTPPRQTVSRLFLISCLLKIFYSKYMHIFSLLFTSNGEASLSIRI